jgi:Family of unknown function (DUF6152)
MSCAWSLAVAAVLGTSSAAAQHSYAAFDATRCLKLEGSVKSFAWSNPHVVLMVLVKPDGGSESQEWRVETSAPGILKTVRVASRLAASR